MKKTNKIALVVVLGLVILFGVGQFFAFSTLPAGNTSVPGTASSTVPTAQSAPSTEVVEYTPPTSAASAPVEKGSCWTNSIAAPFRTDAWRCSVGNSISDPCFTIPNRTSSVLCNINPADPSATSTFVLDLTKPLPAPVPVPAADIPSNWAWLVELSDGTLCSPFTGTLPITATGESANYSCAPGPLGNNLVIFGDLNNSSTVWTAEVGTLSISTSTMPTIISSSTATVSEVWQ